MKARKFDSDFDSGKDITSALDLSRARRPPGAGGEQAIEDGRTVTHAEAKRRKKRRLK